MINLKGKVAAVIGSVGGLVQIHSCSKLAKQGAYIVLMEEISLIRIAKLELGRFTTILSAIVAYVSEINQANESDKTAIQHFGKLDILIKNAVEIHEGRCCRFEP